VWRGNAQQQGIQAGSPCWADEDGEVADVQDNIPPEIARVMVQPQAEPPVADSLLECALKGLFVLLKDPREIRGIHVHVIPAFWKFYPATNRIAVNRGPQNILG